MSERLTPEREAEIREWSRRMWNPLFGCKPDDEMIPTPERLAYSMKDALAELDAIRAENKELWAALIAWSDLAPNIGQILDTVKQEWSADNSWSEWDQSVRDQLSNLARAALEKPR